MRLNFILLFALFVTVISTTLFALSTVIGEVLIKHYLSSIIEKEIKAEYRVESLSLEDNLSFHFSINIEDRDVARVVGYIDLNDLEVIIDYSIVDADTQWFKKLDDFGEFSSKGEVKINFFESRIYALIKTDGDRINFKYRKKFIQSERYLKITNSFISLETLYKLTGIEIAGDKLALNTSLSGDSHLMSGDIEASIGDIDFNGDVEYKYSNGIYISGMSSKLDGEFNVSINKNGTNLELNGIALDKGFTLLNFNSSFRGRGDMKIFYNGDIIKFSGNSRLIKVVNAKYIDYLNELFNLELDKNSFKNLDFNGEINNGFVTFNFSIHNHNIEFLVENGIYNTYDKNIEISPIASIDGDELFSIYFNTSTKKFSITPTEFGIERLKSSIHLNSSGKYRDEITNLINLY